jgi:protein phosphatase
MGGANAGNVASETACKIISEYIKQSYRLGMDSIDIEKMLKNAISSANMEIYDMALKSAELNGMGTTTVIAVIKDGTAVIAHVGDSRAYLAGEELKLITRDHSIVQSLVESGKITPEDAKVHPKKNIITRALGTEENVVADFCEIKLENDVLLLCTDGLSGYAEEKDIFDCLNKNTDTVADELINLAKVGGGGDNITVVIISDK